MVPPHLRRNGRRIGTRGAYAGPVRGVPTGAIFRGRDALIASGIFGCRAPAGVDYVYSNAPAYAILINRQYAEDRTVGASRTRPEEISYVGVGRVLRGHVVDDQRVVGGNRALARAMERGTVVRVVLGPGWLGTRKRIYMYAGLYRIAGLSRDVDRVTGSRVYRFLLRLAA